MNIFKRLKEKRHESQHFFPLLLAQDPKPAKMLLSGYGVELAVKSTEYKAVDDTKVKGQLVTFQTAC